MRLSCLQENLNRGLAVVGRAVATRTTLPITQNVLLSTDGGRLKLSATNLEIAITTWVGAMVEEEGSITVPARLLAEFVGSLPSDTIDITGTERPRSLQLKCGRFDARINGTDAEEFPPIPSVEDGVQVKISSQALRSAIGQTVFAAATEESRPVLTGIKVEVEGDQLTLAAADGFRLAVHRGKVEQGVEEPVGFIIPSRTLSELNRFLGDGDETVEMMMSQAKSQAMFRLSNVELVSQLIQGNFPLYADLLADAMKEIQVRAVVNLSDMLRAARTASIFARDAGGIVKLLITPGPEGGSGQVTISSRAEEMGENTGEVDGQVEGEEAKIAFNSKYLLEVLQAIGGDEVCLQTSGPSRAGVFKAPDSDEYLHLVMPMFINW
jgi:DNA polymerase-3 subunit beta